MNRSVTDSGQVGHDIIQ